MSINEHQNLTNDPTRVFFATMAKGINTAVKGKKEWSKGGAIASVAMVRLVLHVKASGNVEEFDDLIRHMGGINVDRKKAPVVFDASWDYWSDAFSMVASGKDKVSFVRASKKDEDNFTDRGVINGDASTSVNALREASMVGYLIAMTDGIVPEGFTFWTKDQNKMGVTQLVALKLFGDDSKPSQMGEMVEVKSRFSFNRFRTAGRELMIKNGVIEKKKTAEETKAAPTPLRDDLRSLRERLLTLEGKNLGQTERLELSGIIVAALDMLNDEDMGEDRIPSSEYKPIRDRLEKRIEAAANDLDRKIKESLNRNAA